MISSRLDASRLSTASATPDYLHLPALTWAAHEDHVRGTKIYFVYGCQLSVKHKIINSSLWLTQHRNTKIKNEKNGLYYCGLLHAFSPEWHLHWFNLTLILCTFLLGSRPVTVPSFSFCTVFVLPSFFQGRTKTKTIKNLSFRVKLSRYGHQTCGSIKLSISKKWLHLSNYILRT